MKILTLTEVTQRTGLSRSAVYRLRKGGKFPSARKLAMKKIGWLETDLDDWLNSRPATM